MSLAADQRFRGLDRHVHASRDINHFAPQLDATPGDPRHVEQIIEQSSEMHGLPLDDADQRSLILLRHEPSQQLGGIGDRRDRIAQLMRQHCEEFVFTTIRLLERALQLALLGDVLRVADHIVVAGREQSDDEVAARELAFIAHRLAQLYYPSQLCEDSRGALRRQLADPSSDDLVARPAHDCSGVAIDVRVDPIDQRA